MATTSTRAISRGVATVAPLATTARRRTGIDRAYYVMLLPVVALFTLFIIVPAAIGVFYSFTNFVGYGAWHFVGLTNYLSVFTDPTILHAYGFTLLFAVITTVIVNIIALTLAMGLNSRIKWRVGLRGLFFVPMVISGLVIAYVFNYFFSTSLPAIASSLHIGFLESSALASPHLAFMAIVIVSAWQACPGAIIIYLAGLLAIPTEVYEAGSIDGATSWRKFTHITFPLVFGYLIINTILGFKGFLNAYEIIVALTNGGPGTSTFSVTMAIFTGFTNGDYAYQMANAVLFFIVAVTFSLLQLTLIRRRGVSL